MANRPLKKNWTLNEEGFNKLLEALGPDRERSAQQYELLRRSLIQYFDWRGSAWAERDADETLDRVARKLLETDVEDIHSYALGVARNVSRESIRLQQNEPGSIETIHTPTFEPGPDPNLQQRFQCFDSCLAKLPRDKQDLILSYYEGDKDTKISNRRKMAGRAGIPINRLRIQVHRIRQSLEMCINHCLSKKDLKNAAL